MRTPSEPALTAGLLTCAAIVACTAATAYAQPPNGFLAETAQPLTSAWQDLQMAAIRLPLAGLLGTMLALRPRRVGTPARTMSVVETQIILAIVGALIMLVVGASLARAFGIVGAANLIRYRAKIENPKDAVVMLSALAVGLACGVGLYMLAALGTVFVGVALWIIEGFEPEAKKLFELKISFKKGTAADLRPHVEGVLRRHHADFELRASADDAIAYAVNAPADDGRIDRISRALENAAGDAGIAVEWDEKKPKTPS